MRLGIARTHPISDGLHDLVEGAAPQPIVIIEVRIALSAGRADAVARRAIVAEGGLPLSLGEGEQRRVLLDVGQRHLSERRVLGATNRLQFGEIGGDLAAG